MANKKIKAISRSVEHAAKAFAPALFRRFPKAEVYLVGGAVRDALLGRGTQDFDFVVRGVAVKDMQKFLARLGQVDLVGHRFGVLKFIPRGWSLEPIDIALPRTEVSTGGGRKADFAVRSNPRLAIAQDLSRRDFTINAMAWDVKTGRLVDPFGGMQDISRKRIAAVGKPADRFREDHSRVLRALRFAIQLGFAIENDTWRAVKRSMPSVPKLVPPEVAAKEILKSLVVDPVQTLDLWDEAGAWKYLLPELAAMKGIAQPKAFHTEGDVWTHTRLALEMLTTRSFRKLFGIAPTAEVMLGVLFHDIGKPPTFRRAPDRIRFDGHDKLGAHMTHEIVHRLKLMTYKAPMIDADADRLSWIVAHHLLLVSGRIKEVKNRTLERYFFHVKNPGNELLQVMWADIAATIPRGGKPPFQHFQILMKRLAELRGKPGRGLPPPVLSGDDIMRMRKIKPGFEVGAVKLALREEQLAGRVETKKEAERFVKSYAYHNERPDLSHH